MARPRRSQVAIACLSALALVAFVYLYLWWNSLMVLENEYTPKFWQNDVAVSETRCTEGCWEGGHGTCYEETGQCNCIHGFAGPTCSDLAMPSCHMAPGYVALCSMPSSCACSLECVKYRLPYKDVCFDERIGGGKIESDVVRLYGRPQVRFYSDGRGNERQEREIVNGTERMETPYTNPAECPHMCHGRGVCTAGNRTCECAPEWSGASCESETRPGLFRCLSNCSDHGECVEFVCRCHRGYFGADCSLFKGLNGLTERISSPPYLWSDITLSSYRESPVFEPRIYVYELPGEFNTWQFVHWPSLDWPEERLFMERMLASPYRALVGEEADYFYVPLILRNRKGMKESVLKWAIEYISSMWPYYNQFDGADHIFLAEREWAECGVSGDTKVDSLLTRSITVTLRGRTKNIYEETGMQPCFIKGQDILMPPLLDPELYSFSPWITGVSRQVSARTILLYHRARKGRKPDSSEAFTWSRKVDERMFELYDGKQSETGILVTESHGNDHMKQMVKSIFCLAPGGWDWDIRTTEAASLGCIPVVIQTGLVQPYEDDLLHWSTLSIQLEFDDLPRIADILQRIPAVEIEKKREDLSRIWMHFVWSSPQYNPFAKLAKDVQRELVPVLADKDAHATLMLILARRLKNKLKNRTSKCKEVCVHGFCNEEQAVCQCLGGYKGPMCAEVAMPSCHLNLGHHTTCHSPTSCACVAECEAYHFPHEDVCFNEKRADGSIETDVLQLFKGPQARIKFDEHGQETERMPIFNDGFTLRSKDCKGNCSHQEAGWCTCLWDYGGESFAACSTASPSVDSCSKKGDCRPGFVNADCSIQLGDAPSLNCQVGHIKVADLRGSTAVPFRCINDCSGHGKCFKGTCKCSHGFFGIDCSSYLDKDKRLRVIKRSILPRAKALQHSPSEDLFHPKIYVYDIPQYFNTWQFQHSQTMDWLEQFYFIERLLASGYRTSDPDEAHFFFIPLMHRNRGGSAKSTLTAAIEYVKETWPKFWERHEGRDHIIVENGDWGACEVGEYGFSEPLLDKLIVLTPWGHLRNMKLQDSRPCFKPGKDIVIPPVLREALYKHVPHLQDSGEVERRRWLLYFKGSDGVGIDPFGPYELSFGVRQKMFHLYSGRENETGIYLETSGGIGDINDGFLQMRRSIFCLAPSGWGWSEHATKAVILGCIPVIIQPSVVQAFEGDLDWEDFAVILQPEDIPQIGSILRAISTKTIAEKQAACAKIWTRFVWTSPSLNPLKTYAKDVQNIWAPKLATEDVVASVVEILGNRLKQRDTASLWLKKAPVVKQEQYMHAINLPRRFRKETGEAKDVELKEGVNEAHTTCPVGCLDHGTCNEETGRCECKGSYTGPTCEDLAFPACHFEPGYSTPCNYMTSCACKLQCASYRFFTDDRCFDETREDGTVETDIRKLLNRQEVYFLTDDLGNIIEPRRTLPENEWRHDLASPFDCPLNCSGHGVCYKKDNFCSCTWAYNSHGCSTVGNVPFNCYNDCNGRGDCFFGICKCRKGYFGLDCALSIGLDGRTEVIVKQPFSWSNAVPEHIWKSKEVTPKIYVYELPGYFNTWFIQHFGFVNYQEQIFFLERILTSHHRTADPNEADYFYIPLMLITRVGKAGATLGWAISYVKEHWPYWNESDGSDHFVLTNGDWGNCEAGTYGVRGAHFGSMLTITLWGHTKNMEIKDEDPCFIVGKDIVMPPRMPGDVYEHVPFFKEIVNDGTEASPMGQDQRKTLLYFKGFSALGRPESPDEGFSWSLGVRQKMFTLYENRENETGIRLIGSDGLAISDFKTEMVKSIFCFAPAGWGWGMRATQSAILGCIPVVIQPNVVQALGIDLLDWNEFAVVLSKEDIPRIEEILRAIPPDVVRKKQKACAEVWTRFLWVTSSLNPLERYPQELRDKWAPIFAEKDAFASLMNIMGKRAQQQEKNLFKSTRKRKKVNTDGFQHSSQ